MPLRQRAAEIADRAIDEAREWGVSRRVATVVFVFPFAGALVVAVSRIEPSVFRFLTGEDQVIEWAQFFAYAATALIALLLARRLLADGERRYALVFAAVGLAAIVVAGEEISWGQRILGVETPEGLEELNRQGELGAHNIFGVETAFNIGMMLIGFYGSVVAWWLRLRRDRPQSLAFTLLVPALFLGPAFLLAFLHRLARFTVPQLTDVTTFVKFGEWPEFCLAFGTLSFCLLNLRRLRAPQPSAMTPYTPAT